MSIAARASLPRRARCQRRAYRAAAEAAVLRIVDSNAAARRRSAPAIRRCNRMLAMPTVDELTTAQRLALAHFIDAHFKTSRLDVLAHRILRMHEAGSLFSLRAGCRGDALNAARR
jgi:hypothetical protein